MLQVQVIRMKTKTMTKNGKEIKTNIFLTINIKKDENIKILCQKMLKMMF